MPSTTQKDLYPGTERDPKTDSMVYLQGRLQFESIDAKFPSTLPGGLADPVRPKTVGPYVIEAELGRGGMGVVYRARDTRLDRTIALKMILRADYTNAKDLHRFQTEATAVAQLKHPNIVQVYDVGTERDVPFMALEYIEQGTLQRKTQGKPQDARYAAQLVAGMADGIHHAHEHGVLHRDLKPANVLLRQRPVESGSGDAAALVTTDEPVISDFGLAKRLDSTEMITQSGMAVGTPNYMAPEQASGDLKLVGPTSDIYGLGAILYELLTGRPPFQGINQVETLMQVMHLEPVQPRQLQPKVPMDLETICLKCLQKDPARRYGSAAELALDLRRYLQHEVIHARPAGVGERLVRWCRRHPAIATLCTIIFLLLVAGTSVASWFAIKADQRATQLAIEKENAARNLQRARTIIREYLTDVDDDPALRDMISVPLKQKLLSRAMPLLKELLQETGDSQELIGEQAKAFWLLGNIHHVMGQTKDAEQAYLTAIDASRKLVAKNQATLEQYDFLGVSLLNLGKLHVIQGRFEDALTIIKEAETLAVELIPRFTDSFIPKSMLVRALSDQAEVQRVKGNVKLAQEVMAKALTWLDKRKEFGKPAEYTLHMYDLLMVKAQLDIDTGRSQEAIASYQKAREMNEERHQLAQKENEYLAHVARIDHQLGKLYEMQGNPVKAHDNFTKAIGAMKKLSDLEPMVHLHQHSLAVGFGARGMLSLHTNKLPEAEEDLLQELKIMEQLVKVNPTYRNRQELALAEGHHGQLNFYRQKHREGETHLRAALRIYEELLPLQPGDTELRLSLANSRMSLGNMLVGQTRFSQATTEYEYAYDAFTELTKLCPDAIIHHILRGGACCNLGSSLMRDGQAADADPWFQRAHEILAEVSRREPGHVLAHQFRRNTYFIQAEMFLSLNQVARAVECINQGAQLPIQEHEKQIMLRMVYGVQEKLMAAARVAADHNEWKDVVNYAELLSRSVRVSPSKTKEMLKLCCTGLESDEKGKLLAASVLLVKKLKDGDYFQDEKNRQSFREDKAYQPLLKHQVIAEMVK